MESDEGQARYRLRKQTVESVFGIVKEAMGFRQFLLREIAAPRLPSLPTPLGYAQQAAAPGHPGLLPQQRAGHDPPPRTAQRAPNTARTGRMGTDNWRERTTTTRGRRWRCSATA